MAFGSVTVGGTAAPPVPPPEAPPNGAQELVTAGFSSAQAYASNAYNNALNFLQQLSAAAESLAALPVISTTLTPVASAVQAFTTPTAPARPAGMELTIPTAPAEPTLANVTPLALSDAPTFDATPPAIDLNIARPAPLTRTAPVIPALNAVVIPTSDDPTLPDVPTLLGIAVPVAPLLDLPVFAAVAPDSPLAPAYIFSFADTAYTSTLLTGLREHLLAWIEGPATGLDPAVEAALWERGRQREEIASRRKIGEVVRTFARSGFTRPPGAMAIEMGLALQDSQNTLVTASREVMIKQADLEQSNRKFAFEQAWKIEEQLVQASSQMAQRALDAAKFAQQVGIDIFREVVQRYSADIRKYGTDAEVFKNLLQAELSKLEIFKSELEAQRLIGTINEQQVAIYRERVSAAKILVEMFQARISASNAQAVVNKTIIEGFAAETNAYGEEHRAKAAEYQAYATEVNAEVSKLGVFTAQATAYDSQTRGFEATVKALTAAKTSEVEIGQRIPMELFKNRTEVFRTIASAEASRVEAVAKVYTADAQVFGEQVKGEAARVTGEVEVYKADTQLAVAEGDLRVKIATANVQTLVQQTNLMIEAIKGGAQVTAQLAAAALASVNLSAQVGDHTGYNVSNSAANSTSNVNSSSFNTSYSSSQSESTVDSVSTSTTDNVNNTTMNSTVYQYSN